MFISQKHVKRGKGEVITTICISIHNHKQILDLLPIERGPILLPINMNIDTSECV